MAKLHRRVPRLPHHDLSGCARALARGLALVLVATASAPAALAAQDAASIAGPTDPELARLEALSAQLGAQDAGARRAAFEALTSLPAESLPAIRARIEALQRGRPPENWVDDLAHRFRRRGTAAEDEERDVAGGALAELDQDHRETERRYALVLAETLFLWRSLQRIGTDEAHRAAYPLIGLDAGAWLPEARNWVRRAGPRVMAAVIAGRTHEDRYVRQWARWGAEQLGTEEPGRAVQGLEDEVLADVLRAYAALRVQSAMRIVVSYVDSDRRRVRRAARWAIEQYGSGAIWILRTAYHSTTGEHAPREWGFERVRDALYAHVDARRMEPVRVALEEGIAARQAGDLATMKARFDDVLARAPELEQPDPVADGYAAFAQTELEAGRVDAAQAAWRRALRVAPAHPEAGRWETALAFAEAEALRARGVLDRDAYARIVAADPSHGASQAVLTSLERAPPPAGGRDRGPWALVAAALLALLGAALSWARGRGRAALAADPACDSTLEAPTFEDADATWADA